MYLNETTNHPCFGSKSRKTQFSACHFFSIEVKIFTASFDIEINSLAY